MAEVFGVIAASIALGEFIAKVSGSVNGFVTGTRELDENLEAISSELRSISVVLNHMQQLLNDHQNQLNPSDQIPSQQLFYGQPTLLETINNELKSCRDTIATLERKVRDIPTKSQSRFRWIKQASRYRKYTAEIAGISRLKTLIRTHYKALHMLLQFIHLQVALNTPQRVVDGILPYINETRKDIQSLRSQQNAPQVVENPELKVDFGDLLQWAEWFLKFAVTRLLRNDQTGEGFASASTAAASPYSSQPPRSPAIASESSPMSEPLPMQIDSECEADDLDVEVVRMLEARAADLAKRGQWMEAREACATIIRKIAELSPAAKKEFNLNQKQADLAFATLNVGMFEEAAALFTSLHDGLSARPPHELSRQDKGILLSSHQGLAEVFIQQNDWGKAEAQARAAVRGRRNMHGKTNLLTYESIFTLAAALQHRCEHSEAAVLRQMIPTTSQKALRTEVLKLDMIKAVVENKKKTPYPIRERLLADVRKRSLSNTAKLATQFYKYEKNGSGKYNTLYGIKGLTRVVKAGKDVDVLNIIEGFNVTGTGPNQYSEWDGYSDSSSDESELGQWECEYPPSEIPIDEVKKAMLLTEALYVRADAGIAAVLLDKFGDGLVDGVEQSPEFLTDTPRQLLMETLAVRKVNRAWTSAEDVRIIRT